MNAMAGKPEQWATGRADEPRPALLIRSIRPSDAEALRIFHAGLSDEVNQRYFGARSELDDDDLRWFTCVDGADRLAVAAFDGVRLVGLSRADRLSDQVDAEVAVVVDDAHREQGIGTALLERLIDDARGIGIGVFEADVWTSDRRVRSVFHHLGFRVRSSRDVDVARLVFLIGPSATYELACRKRRRALAFEITYGIEP